MTQGLRARMAEQEQDTIDTPAPARYPGREPRDLGVRDFAAAIVGALTVGVGRWVTEDVDLGAALTRSLRRLQKAICDPGGRA